MNEIEMLDQPIFFESTRVWRSYRGGKLLDEFIGNDEPCDGSFPEDWLASATRAENGAFSASPDEGLSRVRDSTMLFSDLLRRWPSEALGHSEGEGLGVLCKFLDSATRLSIQCHPDQEFARTHCNSEYGKTESWLVLSTREIDGEEPYVLLGFKPGVSQERFREAVAMQDIAAMSHFLHQFPVKPGEVYFIPGRMPHAIGPGLLLLEVQEPTDLVVKPERQAGEMRLSERQMWGNLDRDTALSCFDYCGAEPDALLARLKLQPKRVREGNGMVLESIIGSAHTGCFRVDKLTVENAFEFHHDAPWHLGIVVSGSGTVAAGNTAQPIKRGDRFFVSNRIKSLKYRSSREERLQIYMVC